MNITNMKVGDLIKPINGFKQGGKIEIIQILPATNITSGRILVKYHNRSTLNREPLMSWEAADEYVVDVQRMREEKLNKLGI
jgi:hypothetical protein